MIFNIRGYLQSSALSSFKLLGVNMKSLLILIAPFFLFAQSSHPDKVYLFNNREFPCTVINIDEDNERIDFIYGENMKESLVLKAIEKLEIENLGVIYQRSTGFSNDFKELQNFINNRNQQRLKIEAVGGKELSNELSKIFSDPMQSDFLKNKKWSVGLIFIPYYSGENYSISVSSYPESYLYVLTNTFNEINLEWYLNYTISRKFDLTFDLSYSSDYSEQRTVNSDTNIYGSSNNGFFKKSGMDKINIHLGLKYYLFEKERENVNVYFLAGFGRQFAFAKESLENLFPNPNTPVIEDNMGDFLEDINSPWHLNAGFGTEYFLNNSVSLTSVIRFLYASASGTFKKREISQYYTKTSEFESTFSKVITRIGLGLNFYF